MGRKKDKLVVIQTEEHHRRPRSLGGSNLPFNVSYVTPKLHKAWHILFGNMNAEQITSRINSFPQKPKGTTIVCDFINGTGVSLRGKNNSNNRKKCKRAWIVLFGDLSFNDAISCINNIWLDPSYHIYLA